ASQRRSRPIFDAPTGFVTSVGARMRGAIALQPAALWADDQKHAVLINTALPLSSSQNDEHAHMAYIAAYNVQTRKWTEIEPLQTKDSTTGKLLAVAQAG